MVTAHRALELRREGNQRFVADRFRTRPLVVGAEYSLETGAVDFFEGVRREAT